MEDDGKGGSNSEHRNKDYSNLVSAPVMLVGKVRTQHSYQERSPFRSVGQAQQKEPNRQLDEAVGGYDDDRVEVHDLEEREDVFQWEGFSVTSES